MIAIATDYDKTTIRRCHDAFDYDGSDRNCDSTTIRPRQDYDEQEAQLSLGWPTVLPHSRRSMQKLWCIHANRSSRFLVIGIARFTRIDPKCNQVVPWSLHTFPENFVQIGLAVFSYCCWQRNKHRGIPRFTRIDAKRNQVVPWSLHTFPENFMQIGLAVLPGYKTSQTDRQTDRWHAVPKVRPIVRSAKNCRWADVVFVDTWHVDLIVNVRRYRPISPSELGLGLALGSLLGLELIRCK